MDTFSIETRNFDLETTLTCGQTFCWHRTEGELYGEGSDRFYTFRNRKPLIVEQREDGTLFAETELSSSEVKEALGLHHNLDEIFSEFPEDEPISVSRKEYRGLRIINDEFFPCLISYILSPQMRIERIKKMHNEVARRYGSTVEYNGKELLRFPTREELSEATEEELRDIGTGYRAEYVAETVKKLSNGHEVDRSEYERSVNDLKELHGVGDKVADCVALFSMNHLEATPLDTWAMKAVETHYPEHHENSYNATAENLREYFGSNAGYALEYMFHAARNDIIGVE